MKSYSNRVINYIYNHRYNNQTNPSALSVEFISLEEANLFKKKIDIINSFNKNIYIHMIKINNTLAHVIYKVFSNTERLGDLNRSSL